VNLRVRNLFQGVPARLPDEHIESIARGDGVRVERIVSRGHVSPPDFWYDQDEDEWVMVAAGRARLRFADGEVIDLSAGDHLLIPAHVRHRVDWTDPDRDTVWLAVFYTAGSR
jgi:cupin 2 domain-containing protein